jgi:hypothetical protein
MPNKYENKINAEYRSKFPGIIPKDSRHFSETNRARICSALSIAITPIKHNKQFTYIYGNQSEIPQIYLLSRFYSKTRYITTI